MSDEMDAVVLESFGGPEVLQWQRVAAPAPGPGELRVAVGAVTVMRTRDASTRSGTGAFSQFVTLPHILGGEFAGVVDAVGADADQSWLGQRVSGSSVLPCGRCQFCVAGHDEACSALQSVGVQRPGAYAQAVVVPVENVHALPDDLSFAQGAVLAANGPVAHAQLAASGARAGQWIAVTGAAGALGSTIIGMAAQRGISTIAIARDSSDSATLTALGAAAVVTHHAADLTDALVEATSGLGLAAVIDNLCVEDIWSSCLAALAPMGRAVVSGAVGPAIGTVNLRRLYVSNQSIIGIRTGNRAHTHQFWDDISQNGIFPMAPIRSFPLSHAVQAHQDLEVTHKVGHLVLTVDHGQAAS